MLAQALLLTVPIVLLLLVGGVPSALADRHAHRFRRFVTRLAAVQFAAAGASAAWAITSGSWVEAWFVGLFGESLAPSVYYDGVSSLMLLLVSFLGYVVCRYSIRYLDGEATQGRYFRWIGFTVGAVCAMVVSGNLLLFFLAWIATSFGLHRLLLHYPQRPAAHRAAWMKFAVSRVGDLFLIAAIALTFTTFGTLQFPELFSAVDAAAAGTPDATRTADSDTTAALTAIAWFLVIGAAIKSAQFPFHTWLPETMETPTPVSALMHAGIVNAGGYLVIRTSPLVIQAPQALLALALIGTVTACLAGIVMLTQTSVKRTLAYSTIAQMGFMMLQCGLGAFSAAMLHILAHSLYKAHAFLISGDVLKQAAATRVGKRISPQLVHSVLLLLLAAGLTVGSYAPIAMAFGLDHALKPGGYLLAFVFCLALTTWGWRIMTSGTLRDVALGFATSGILSSLYVISYLAVDRCLVGSTPSVAMLSSTWVAMGIAGIAFGMLFVLQATLARDHQPDWLKSLYVHASNGFYVDTVIRRVFGSLTSV